MQAASKAALERVQQALDGKPAAVARLVEELAVPALDSALEAADRQGDNRAAAAYARQAAALCEAAAKLLAKPAR